MKYAVGLTQTVYEETTIIVEADSADDAELAAIERATCGDCEWRFLECCDNEGYGVASIKEQGK